MAGRLARRARMMRPRPPAMAAVRLRRRARSSVGCINVLGASRGVTGLDASNEIGRALLLGGLVSQQPPVPLSWMR